jgi:hypothetical protein
MVTSVRANVRRKYTMLQAINEGLCEIGRRGGVDM